MDQTNESNVKQNEQNVCQTNLQVHPQLQAGMQPNVSLLPEPVQPVLHPSLQSQPLPEAEVQPEKPEAVLQSKTESQPTESTPPTSVPDTLPTSNAPGIIPFTTDGVELPEPLSSIQEVSNNEAVAVHLGDSAPASDGISELHVRAGLAASRVKLMDATLDVLVTTFKNKYSLDKALEKRCAKLLRASEYETNDKELKEGLQILENSTNWIKENLRNLDQLLHEKHRNVQIAGPLVDAKHERKKEEKQVSKIHKLAGKIGERAMKREERERKKGATEGQDKLVEDAWKQIPLDS